MREIALTNSPLVVLVDDIDFDWLSRFRWKVSHHGYAHRFVTKFPKPTSEFMHRVLACPGPGLYVDHANRNKLDNRRGNLRIVTRSQNNQNQLSANMRSGGFKGATWNRRLSKWQAKICLNGMRKHLGFFEHQIDAALAYDAAARELFGSFALCNNPDES